MNQTGCTDDVFEDFLVNCDDYIQVNAIFTPATPYTWVITDKFGKEYSGSVTTDSEGKFRILTEDLPDGFLTQFSGVFSLKIQDTDCKFLDLKIARYYKQIDFWVKGGTREKNTLGCDVDCSYPELSSGQTAVFPVFAQSEMDIEWTTQLRSLYGNTPIIQVYKRRSAAPYDVYNYDLITVQITHVSNETILESIHLDFGGGMVGYVIVG